MSKTQKKSKKDTIPNKKKMKLSSSDDTDESESIDNKKKIKNSSSSDESESINNNKKIKKSLSSDDESESTDDNILEIHVKQMEIFIRIVKIISDVVSDCLITFIRKNKNNMGGMEIKQLTDDKTVFIDLILYADSFALFKCKEPEIKICININEFKKRLDICKNKNGIILCMKKDKKELFRIESIDKKKNYYIYNNK